MQTDAFTSLVQPIQTTRTVMWATLTAAILLYVVVACVTFGVPSTTAGAFSSYLALPVTAIALASAVAARVLPNFLLSRQRARDLSNPDPDPRELARNPRTGRIDEERCRKIEGLMPNERRLVAVAQASLSPFIIRLALQQSIAQFGLVLAFLSHTVVTLIPFAAAALILNLSVSPRLDSELATAQDAL